MTVSNNRCSGQKVEVGTSYHRPIILCAPLNCTNLVLKQSDKGGPADKVCKFADDLPSFKSDVEAFWFPHVEGEKLTRLELTHIYYTFRL